MEEKIVFDYLVHIADNQTRIAEAMASMDANQARMNEAMASIEHSSAVIAAILERVIQTTDRTEQMVARILAGTATVSSH